MPVSGAIITQFEAYRRDRGTPRRCIEQPLAGFSVLMIFCPLSRSFASSSLWGKFGGLYACGGTVPYIVPLPNIFLTHLFSKLRLKRKDFQEIVRLTWAQEVWSSNLHAPTKSFSITNLQKPNFGTAALWCNLGTTRKSHAEKSHANFA